MQTDFHYYALKVIALESGFDEKEAELLAYASQYVDDCSDYSYIKVTSLPSELKALLSPLISRGRIRRVATVCRGLGLAAVLLHKTQREIYIPFHFLPEKLYPGTGPYCYSTRRNSPFANALITQAVRELGETRTRDQRERKLIKLGIALHTYADTWAHESFSGRRSGFDNDVSYECQPGIFEKVLDEFVQRGFDALRGTMIGHTQALFLPDKSNLEWTLRYRDPQSRVEVKEVRDNTRIFLDAAEHIYILLRGISGAADRWSGLRPALERCFSLDTLSLEQKIAEFRKVFPQHAAALRYDDMSWEREAMTRYDDDVSVTYEYNDDNKWYYFQLEALAQRDFVLAHIRRDME